MKSRSNEEVKMMIEHLKYNKCDGCHNFQPISPKFQTQNVNIKDFMNSNKQVQIHPFENNINYNNFGLSGGDLVNYLKESQAKEFNDYNGKQEHTNDRSYPSTNKLNEMLILANLFFFKGTDLSIDIKLLEEELNSLRNLTADQEKELENKKELEEELKKTTFNLHVSEEVNKKNRENISELEIDKNNGNKLISEQQLKIKSLEEHIEMLLKKIEDLEAEVKNKNELEAELKSDKELINEYEKSKIIAEVQMKSINQFIEKLQLEITELKTTIFDKDKQINSNNQALDDLREQINEYNLNIFGKENQVNRSFTLIETYKLFIQESTCKLNEIERLNNKIKDKESIITDKDGVINFKEEEIKSKENSIESKENEIKNMKKIITNLQDELKEEKNNFEGKDGELKIKNKLVDNLEEDIKHYDKSIEEKDNLIKSFEETLRKTHEQEENMKNLFTEKLKIWTEEKEDLQNERNLTKNENSILKKNIKSLEEKINLINEKVESLIHENKILEEENKVNAKLISKNNDYIKTLGKLDYEQNNITQLNNSYLNESNIRNNSPIVAKKNSFIKQNTVSNTKLSPQRFKSMSPVDPINKLLESKVYDNNQDNQTNSNKDSFKVSDSNFFGKDNLFQSVVKQETNKQLNNLNNSVTRDNVELNNTIKKKPSFSSPNNDNLLSSEHSNKVITFQNMVDSEYHWQNGSKKFSNASDKFETMSLKNTIKGNFRMLIKINKMTHGIHLGVSAKKIELSDLKNRAFLGKYSAEYAYNLFSGYFWKNDKKYKKLEKTVQSGDQVEMIYENGVLSFVLGGETFVAFKNVPENTYVAATIMNKDDSIEIIKVEML